MPQHMTKDEARKQYYRICDALDVGAPPIDISGPAVERIRLSARKLDWLNLRECNGVTGPDGHAKWDDADQAENDRIRETHQTHVVDAFATLFDTDTLTRIRIEFQGDPRGPAIRIHEKDGAQDIGVFW